MATLPHNAILQTMGELPPIVETRHTAPGRLRDRFGRAITDLRVSVTDRCNYRCVYCRSGEGGPPVSELPIADYARMIALLVQMGVEKVRLTGGEPLLRRGLVDLIRQVRSLRVAFNADDFPTRDGAPVEMALTTNGHLLAGVARQLKDAGLNRVTVSMDAVDPETFARITRVPSSFQKVLDGIHAAQDVGLAPVKVNCVLLRGWNDDQIELFGEFARRENVVLRALLQQSGPGRGAASLSCRTRQAGWRFSVSLKIAMASASALAPMPKARSTRRASPRMSWVKLKSAAWPLRSARITSNPMMVA